MCKSFFFFFLLLIRPLVDSEYDNKHKQINKILKLNKIFKTEHRTEQFQTDEM